MSTSEPDDRQHRNAATYSNAFMIGWVLSLTMESLEDTIYKLDMSHGLGPMVDPTLYREALSCLNEWRKLFVELEQARHAFMQLEKAMPKEARERFHQLRARVAALVCNMDTVDNPADVLAKLG